MKSKNIFTLERAAGLIEGACIALDEKVASCLFNAVEMIDAVILDEEKEQNR